MAFRAACGTYFCLGGGRGTSGVGLRVVASIVGGVSSAGGDSEPDGVVRSIGSGGLQFFKVEACAIVFTVGIASLAEGESLILGDSEAEGEGEDEPNGEEVVRSTNDSMIQSEWTS